MYYKVNNKEVSSERISFLLFDILQYRELSLTSYFYWIMPGTAFPLIRLSLQRFSKGYSTQLPEYVKKR